MLWSGVIAVCLLIIDGPLWAYFILYSDDDDVEFELEQNPGVLCLSACMDSFGCKQGMPDCASALVCTDPDSDDVECGCSC